MSELTPPTGEQLVMLAKLAMHVALPLHALSSNNVEYDLRDSITLHRLTRLGYVELIYSPDEGVSSAKCTRAGRRWVRAFQREDTWRKFGVMH